MTQTDYYQSLLKRLAKGSKINPRRIRFESRDTHVIIHLKNHLREGVDLDCLQVLTLIQQTLQPLGIKYEQQLYLYPSHERLDRITITFKKDDYVLLNQKLATGTIDH